MKIDPETEASGPPGSSEPEASVGPENESRDPLKERELDELRRFRVRTVPPDMRRQWLLAETPHVATVELQDTEPPNRSGLSTPSPPPPEVSMNAKTRKLPHVALREERSKNVVLVSAVVALVAVVIVLVVWRTSPRPSSTDAGHAPESTTNRVVEFEPARGANQPAAAEPGAASPTLSSADPAHEPRPERSAPIVTPATTRAHPKDSVLRPQKPSSEKIRSDTDIKAPLFGN